MVVVVLLWSVQRAGYASLALPLCRHTRCISCGMAACCAVTTLPVKRVGGRAGRDVGAAGAAVCHRRAAGAWRAAGPSNPCAAHPGSPRIGMGAGHPAGWGAAKGAARGGAGQSSPVLQWS
eukprot:1157442-Pelagomonas_calceolata.AAC.1